MHRLTGLDAAFLYLETPKTPMNVASVSIYDPATPTGQLDFLTFRNHVAARIHLVRTYRERLAMVPLNLDAPSWVEDPDFDLDLHLHHTALPKPGGWAEVRDLMARFVSRPLDRSRPLWEMTFVEGLDTIPGVPPGSVAILGKAHHAAIDGMSGADMLSALLDPTPEPRPVPAAPPWRPESTPGDLEMLTRTYFELLRQPFKALDIIPGAIRTALQLPAVPQVLGAETPPLPFTAPRTRLNRPVSARRTWDGILIPLPRIKAVKDLAPGTTVNDVILTICAGALRRYLQETGDLPKKPLIAMAPISTREMSARGTMGNQVSAMLIDLATDEADPLRRFAHIHAGATQSKAYQKAVDARSLTNAPDFVPFGLANLASRLYTGMEVAGQHAPVYNCVITNVPGPQQPLYMSGARLLANLGAGPIYDGLGLIITIFSYAGTVAISATSDHEIMPNIDAFMRHIEDSLAELETALRAKPAGAGPAPAPST
ncbi:MAG TPA: wax ester/triacylglycerol synthase family O-acyltransferase [Chloroflexia bacterium]|nr:wax ester/triacylglycerol synthase family O-acyltransferase [Chloroflexia bacterium]